MVSNSQKIQTLFYKRWASLSVKILRYQNTIVNCVSSENEFILRTQLKVLGKIKQAEKISIETMGLPVRIKNP